MKNAFLNNVSSPVKSNGGNLGNANKSIGYEFLSDTPIINNDYSISNKYIGIG